MKKTNVKNIALSGRKQMTPEQEFEIMKLVLDKFLWLGFVLMAYALYRLVANTLEGIIWLVTGIIVLLLFTWILVREYEFVVKK